MRTYKIAGNCADLQEASKKQIQSICAKMFKHTKIET